MPHKQPPFRMPGGYNVEAAEPIPMPIIIAVMGITGVGKSFFIKAAGACQPDTGGVPVIGDTSLRACTIDTDLFHIPGTNINLMDTPGFDDTFSNDSDILSRIANCLANFHNERIPVSGILYLHPIDQPRMKGSDMKNLEVFREIVGKRNIANCFFVTTKWSKVSDEEGALREQELVEDGSFWKLMLDQGAQVMRFRGTRRSATEIIHSLCSAVDPLGFKPKITIEYCEEGRSINETSAGAIVNKEVEAVRKELGKQIEQMKKDREEAERRIRFEQDEKEREFQKRQAELAAKMEERLEAEAKKFAEAQKKGEETRRDVERKFALTQKQLEEKQKNYDEWRKEYQKNLQMQKDKTGYGLARLVAGVAGALFTIGTGGLGAPIALGVYGLTEAVIDDDKAKKGYKKK